MSLKYFKTALPFQSAFMAAPYFCCKGCKSPLESGALLDCQGGDEYSSADA
jgi:hypothetical protein